MQAIKILNPGDNYSLQLAESATPQPKNDEVLIRVSAAGVNRPDIMQCKGMYPPPPGASHIPGLEISGIVTQTGKNVETLQVGNQVCALVSGGGYSEFCTAVASSCLLIPDTFDLLKAAALPETFFTVWSNLFMRGKLQKGETLLLHGGSSGIGSTAIQIAKAFGAKIITTARTDEKCQFCLALGADYAINYKTQDFVAEIKKITEQRGVDIILDMIAGDYLPRNIKCLASDGRLIIIAVQNGPKCSINVLPIMLKRLTITGSTLRARSTDYKAQIAEELRIHVWPKVEKGIIRPIIDRTFPLQQAHEAHQYMQSGMHKGKILLATKSLNEN